MIIIITIPSRIIVEYWTKLKSTGMIHSIDFKMSFQKTFYLYIHSVFHAHFHSENFCYVYHLSVSTEISKAKSERFKYRKLCY